MRQSKIVFYVYSGTGNSRRVAVWAAEVAEARGLDAEILSITSEREAEQTRDIVDGDNVAWIVVVTPTHGFTAPEGTLRAVLRMPGCPSRKVPVLVMATRGATRIGPWYLPGFEGSATLLLGAILALKGYRVRGLVGIDMPSNWTALHSGLAPDAVAAILDRARIRTTAWTDAVLGGERRPIDLVTLLVGLLLLPVSLGYLLVGRRFLGKLFFASERCTGCGLCAAHCPHGAIEMRGPPDHRRPYWTTRCQSCMRCMAYCPEQAVEANHLLAVAAFVLAARLPVAGAAKRAADRAPGLAWLARLPRWLLTLASGSLLWSLSYALVHRLLGLRWLHRLLSWLALTRRYRRYHEPGTTLKELAASKMVAPHSKQVDLTAKNAEDAKL